LSFLEDPDRLLLDGYTAFSSALWFYMTPQAPRPSMHDVMTGYFEPNDADITHGISGGFGSTINIISPDECGHGVKDRSDLYLQFLRYFADDKDLTEENIDCENE